MENNSQRFNVTANLVHNTEATRENQTAEATTPARTRDDANAQTNETQAVVAGDRIAAQQPPLVEVTAPQVPAFNADAQNPANSGLSGNETLASEQQIDHSDDEDPEFSELEQFHDRVMRTTPDTAARGSAETSAAALSNRPAGSQTLVGTSQPHLEEVLRDTAADNRLIDWQKTIRETVAKHQLANTVRLQSELEKVAKMKEAMISDFEKKLDDAVQNELERRGQVVHAAQADIQAEVERQTKIRVKSLTTELAETQRQLEATSRSHSDELSKAQRDISELRGLLSDQAETRATELAKAQADISKVWVYSFNDDRRIRDLDNGLKQVEDSVRHLSPLAHRTADRLNRLEDRLFPPLRHERSPSPAVRRPQRQSPVRRDSGRPQRSSSRDRRESYGLRDRYRDDSVDDRYRRPR